MRLPAGLQHSLAVEAEAQRQARVRVSQPGAGVLPPGAVLWGTWENPKGLLMQNISPALAHFISRSSRPGRNLAVPPVLPTPALPPTHLTLLKSLSERVSSLLTNAAAPSLLHPHSQAVGE